MNMPGPDIVRSLADHRFVEHLPIDRFSVTAITTHGEIKAPFLFYDAGSNPRVPKASMNYALGQLKQPLELLRKVGRASKWEIGEWQSAI